MIISRVVHLVEGVEASAEIRTDLRRIVPFQRRVVETERMCLVEREGGDFLWGSQLAVRGMQGGEYRAYLGAPDGSAGAGEALDRIELEGRHIGRVSSKKELRSRDHEGM